MKRLHLIVILFIALNLPAHSTNIEFLAWNQGTIFSIESENLDIMNQYEAHETQHIAATRVFLGDGKWYGGAGFESSPMTDYNFYLAYLATKAKFNVSDAALIPELGASFTEEMELTGATFSLELREYLILNRINILLEYGDDEIIGSGFDSDMLKLNFGLETQFSILIFSTRLCTNANFEDIRGGLGAGVEAMQGTEIILEFNIFGTQDEKESQSALLVRHEL